MKDHTLLELLEDAARKLSMKVEYDDLRKGEVNTPGGAFRLRDERRILIHKGLSAAEKAELLTEILSDFDTEAVHLPTEVRRRLEEARARSREAGESGAGPAA
ncbi:MAG TPA: hypothetical protein ENJ37_02270 [Deltaproteobacteria bacterium]|nr:hypothetical protein [Deltaproteobacteria bacterium]